MASVLISVSGSEELEDLGGVAKWDGGSSSDILKGLGVTAQLGSVSLVPVTLGTSTANAGASTHDTSVDGARDTILLLNINLGQVELLLVIGRVLLDISPGGSVDHLSHLEALDRFVLGHDTGAVDAPHDVGVSLVFLSSSVVSSL